jgi:hypothetical protein
MDLNKDCSLNVVIQNSFFFGFLFLFYCSVNFHFHFLFFFFFPFLFLFFSFSFCYFLFAFFFVILSVFVLFSIISHFIQWLLILSGATTNADSWKLCSNSSIHKALCRSWSTSDFKWFPADLQVAIVR